MVLAKISQGDLLNREVQHNHLMLLALLVLGLWVIHPNYDSLIYLFIVLVAGFFLFMLKLLGAGDTKLLAVLVLGIDPVYFSAMLYLTVMLGALMALGYLVYGLLTDLRKVRKKGIPYAIPISISCYFFIVLSYLKWFSTYY